jgi:hypothetical protein
MVFTGNLCCANSLAEKINANKYTMGAIAFGTALPKDADAAKAAVETTGVLLDNSNKSNPLAVPVNFVVNWGVRKALRGMGANNIKLSHFGSANNDAVGTIVEAINVATPQIVASLVIMAVESSSSSQK